MTSVVRPNSIQAIAKGGVGCIVTPALQCTNYLEPNDLTRISKIFTSEGEYQEELATSEELTEKLADVKNRSNFFIYEATDCTLDATQKERLNKQQIEYKCGAAIAKSNVYVLNYDYGGESIESILQKSLPINIINDVLLNLHNLFQGVILLNQHLIYHLDLSTDNVLLSENRTMKIIDFGRCFIAPTDESFTSLIIRAHFKKNAGNFGKPRFVAPELLATIIGGKYMINAGMKNLLYAERKVNLEYFTSLEDEIKANPHTLKKCFEKADVWALGGILYTIREKIKLKDLELDALIDNFTNIDLVSRADPSQAYKLYKKFVENFKRQMNSGDLLTPSPTPSPTSLHTPSSTSSPTSLHTPSSTSSSESKKIGGRSIKRRSRRKTHRKTKKRQNKKRKKLTRRI